MRTLFLFAILGLVALAGLLGPAAVQAEVRAVLVGVSDYDDATGIDDLAGPANDVRLLRDVLNARGVDRITLLADGVEGGTRPTRQAILDALSAQAQQAKEGDFVYLHFSGHGTRQPDRSGDETDGLDEVFLPADTGKAQAQTGLITNALVDDEIGQAVNAIRARGADVWLVLDSCHSGTGLRSAGAGGVSRYVDPSILDVSAAPATPGPAVDQPEDADLPGRYIAFYSARADEVAREYDLDPGEGEAFYGLFTATLAARLEGAQGWSFRQLFQAVLSDMNDASLPGVARLQTPSWDGDLIDTPVLQEGTPSGARRFAVKGDALSAGIVHNIADGTVVALLAGPADPLEAALGYAQVTGASATAAYLTPVDPGCEPVSQAPCARSGDLPGTARFAQVVARPVDLTLRLRPPLELASGAVLSADHPVMQALTQAVTSAEQAMELNATEFEVETVWDGDTLWFGRRAALGKQPAGLAWTPGQVNGVPLQTLLTRIHRAESFARLMDGLSGGGGLFNQNPLQITGQHLPSRVADLTRTAPIEPVHIECDRAFRAVNNDPLVALPRHADIKQCDRLMFMGQGQTDGIRDVNVLHIDAQFCVKASYAQVSGFSRATQLGGVINVCSDCENGNYSAGDERVYVIVTEAVRNGAALRLQGLVETCEGGPTRGPKAQTGLVETLGEMVKQTGTRGSFGSLGVSNIWVERYDLTVLPRQQVFLRADSE